MKWFARRRLLGSLWFEDARDARVCQWGTSKVRGDDTRAAMGFRIARGPQ
jgi:hypothetical protein